MSKKTKSLKPEWLKNQDKDTLKEVFGAKAEDIYLVSLIKERSEILNKDVSKEIKKNLWKEIKSEYNKYCGVRTATELLKIQWEGLQNNAKEEIYEMILRKTNERISTEDKGIPSIINLQIWKLIEPHLAKETEYKYFLNEYNAFVNHKTFKQDIQVLVHDYVEFTERIVKLFANNSLHNIPTKTVQEESQSSSSTSPRSQFVQKLKQGYELLSKSSKETGEAIKRPFQKSKKKTEKDDESEVRQELSDSSVESQDSKANLIQNESLPAMERNLVIAEPEQMDIQTEITGSNQGHLYEDFQNTSSFEHLVKFFNEIDEKEANSYYLVYPLKDFGDSSSTMSDSRKKAIMGPDSVIADAITSMNLTENSQSKIPKNIKESKRPKSFPQSAREIEKQKNLPTSSGSNKTSSFPGAMKMFKIENKTHPLGTKGTFSQKHLPENMKPLQHNMSLQPPFMCIKKIDKTNMPVTPCIIVQESQGSLCLNKPPLPPTDLVQPSTSGLSEFPVQKKPLSLTKDSLKPISEKFSGSKTRSKTNSPTGSNQPSSSGRSGSSGHDSDSTKSERHSKPVPPPKESPVKKKPCPLPEADS